MSRKTYYWTCPKCGANLDPGESCDCEHYSAVSKENKTISNIGEENHETTPTDDRCSHPICDN